MMIQLVNDYTMKNNVKQVLFAHSAGAQGGPGQGSFDMVSSLKTALGKEYEVHYPIIDDPEAPTYAMWKKIFESEFKKVTQPVILIGHSLGGSTFLKYLSEEQPHISISGLFLVAIPHWGENGWDVDDFVLKENFEKSLVQVPEPYLYHSKHDEIVPFRHLDFYRKAFKGAKVRELDGTDHAFEKGLPELVSDIQKL